MNVSYPRTLAVSLVMMAAVGVFSIAWYRVERERAWKEARWLIESEKDFYRVSVTRAEADLSAQLAALLETESARPFYHYQNLYHEPRGAYENGISIIPSPLAEGTGSPWIRAHFQIDARGLLTLPTLNEEAPKANSGVDLAAQRRIRDALLPLAESFRRAANETPLQTEGMTTQFVPYPGEALTQSAEEAPSVPVQEEESPRQQAYSSGKIQRQQMDQGAWEQNSMASSLYNQLKEPGKEGRVSGKGMGTKQAASGTVQIDTEAFSWSPAIAASDGLLVALRRVMTPDGILVQGFQVDHDQIDALLGKAGHRLTGAPEDHSRHLLQKQEFDEGRWVTYAGPAIDPAGLPPCRYAGHPHTASETLLFQPLAQAPGGITLDISYQLDSVKKMGSRIVAQIPWRWFRVFCYALVPAAFTIVMVAGAESLALRRSRFAAAAAHELRTPLAGLRMYSEMLAEGLGDPARARDYARRLADESARLGRVVANMLGFTRIERGNFSVQPESGDLAEAVRGTIETSRPSLEALGASLAVDLPREPLTARFDRDAVAQILQNLLDNAEKYGRGGADRTITVRLAQADGKAVLTVADRGPGIPPDDRRRLFTPFRRGADPDAPAGLGLGLAITRSLARAQGGDVTHADNPGGGSAFIVTFPA